MTHAHHTPHVHPPHIHGHHPHPHGMSVHPAQAASSSLLRMPVGARLMIALAFIAVLWTVVLLAIR